MDDRAKKRLFFKIVAGVRDDGTVDLSHDGQTVVSPATYYRLLGELEQDKKIMKVSRGVYACLLPPSRAKSPILRNMMGMLGDLRELVDAFNKFQDSYMNRFWLTVEESIEQCMACECYPDCMTGRKKSCKLDRVPLSGPELEAVMRKLDGELGKLLASEELFSRENDIPDRSYIDQDQGRERQFSGENNSEENSFVTEKEQEGGGSKGDEVGKEGKRVDTDHRMEEARAIIRQRIHETSIAPKERSVKEQKGEVWKVWTECMAKGWDGVSAGKLMGKESQLMVQLIAAYGLELTKKAVVVYFDQWENLKAENAWIDSPVPNVSLFYKLRERIFPAASGKVKMTDRVSKRTADEYVEDDGSGNNGRWPDREGPKATSPA